MRVHVHVCTSHYNNGASLSFHFPHSLMSQIPDLFSGNKTSEVVLEPVVQAGLEALKVQHCY